MTVPTQPPSSGAANGGAGEPRPPRLSEEIAALVVILAERPLQLREMLKVMHGRAYTLLLILLSLPFCTPIPIPGLSTLFGALIAIIGLRLSLRQQPWLPARILDAKVSPKVVMRLLGMAKKTAKSLELLLKPRMSFLIDYPFLHHFYGAIICISGALLLLPLPIPFSNILPALTVIFLSAALLERDGYFVIAGLVAFAVSLLFFGAIFLGGAAVVNWLEQFFGGVLDPDEQPPPELEKLLEEFTPDE
ncbi:MAG: exopolysaccharide biosynthesis protein [Verrucomicrobiota bacterium]|nr:exopolysaccharide biosynthesis protein [Verrucomicrobiota bacterium]